MIIKVPKGANKAEIARKYGIVEDTFRKWCKETRGRPSGKVTKKIKVTVEVEK